MRCGRSPGRRESWLSEFGGRKLKRNSAPPRESLREAARMIMERRLKHRCNSFQGIARPGNLLICLITRFRPLLSGKPITRETMTMIWRSVAAAGLFVVAFCIEAHASRQHRPTGHVSCSDVKYYVAKYSASVAEIYARSRGATDAQIQRARRCLASAEAAEAGQRSLRAE
jgi:hypothetical protein